MLIIFCRYLLSPWLHLWTECGTVTGWVSA